jgi:two-component system, chemotaxis family, chemotaxis protein CheY
LYTYTILLKSMTKNVLIVDDSTFMRTVLKQILLDIDSKVEVDEAGNGKEAIQKCASNNYDLVLLDIIMPETNGLQVLEKIGKNAKVIVISAVGQTSITDEVREYGAVDYINKPFDDERVAATIRTYL